MKIPQYILNKVDQVNRYHQLKVKGIEEIEQWLVGQGFDIDDLRNERDVISDLDYGMTSNEFQKNIDNYLIDNEKN